MVNLINYEMGSRYRRMNVRRSENPYGKVMAGLVPCVLSRRELTRAMLLWFDGWDDQDAELAMEMS